MADFITVRFYDDNQSWSIPRKIDISSGQNPNIELRSMGCFRERMIEITVDAETQILICGAEDDVEDLAR